jgi:predicted RNA binding protein YcfA (HicA-like mRNA interferase family)
MTKRDRLRRRLRNNPKGAKFSEIETLLLGFGFTLDRVSGSHHLFRYDMDEDTVSVIIPVHGNSVKTHYVKEVTELLDAMFPEDDTSREEEDSDE